MPANRHQLGGWDRGEEARQPSFVFFGPLEDRVPKNHPLRAIRAMTDKALSALSPLFAGVYSLVHGNQLLDLTLVKVLLMLTHPGHGL